MSTETALAAFSALRYIGGGASASTEYKLSAEDTAAFLEFEQGVVDFEQVMSPLPLPSASVWAARAHTFMRVL